MFIEMNEYKMKVFILVACLLVVTNTLVKTTTYPGRTSGLNEYGRLNGWTLLELPNTTIASVVFTFRANYSTAYTATVFHFVQEPLLNVSWRNLPRKGYSFAHDRFSHSYLYDRTPSAKPMAYCGSIGKNQTMSPVTIRIAFDYTARHIDVYNAISQKLLVSTRKHLEPVNITWVDMTTLRWFCVSSWEQPIVFSNINVTVTTF